MLYFISIFNHLLIADGNTTDLNVLIRNVTFLLHLLMNSGSLLVDAQRFSMWTMMSSVNKGVSFLPSQDAFELFFLPYPTGWTPQAVKKKQREQTYFVLDFENAICISPLNVACGFLYVPCQVEEVSFYSQFAACFHVNWELWFDF